MRNKEYDRNKAIQYAKKWAYGRNKKYYDFEKIGGDCTNFVSQCIYAGSGKMYYDKLIGWYYNSVSDRSPSWTGVEPLYKFLTGNVGVGPFGREVSDGEIEIGDVVQLSFDGVTFGHNLIVVDVAYGIRVAAHSFDVYGKDLMAYKFNKARFVHIDGVKM